MEEFPPNSRVTKVTKISKETPEPKPEKLEKIVEGQVIRRKTPLGKRFMSTFFGGDAKGVFAYVLNDVLLPAAKDTIADVVSQGVERMIFGEARSTSRRTGSRPSGNNGYVSYNRYSSGPVGRRDEPRFNPSRQARAQHDFGQIILETRNEAEEVIDRLFALVEKYENASIADLYELVGVTGAFTDAKYGWTDLRGAGITRVSNGYLLELPRPELLN